MNFSVRDCLWLTLVVALICGWAYRERQHESLERLCDKAWDYNDDDKTVFISMNEQEYQEWCRVAGPPETYSVTPY